MKSVVMILPIILHDARHRIEWIPDAMIDPSLMSMWLIRDLFPF